MTPLCAHLKAQIARTGPISVAEFMATCLLHPEHGYYSTGHPIGRRGDFVTAPEISQMFGEMLGLALAQSWMDQGAPEACALVELGPGKGTLMADVLRTIRAVPGFAEAVQVHLVEASPSLKAAQHQALQGTPAQWHDTVDTLPGDLPVFLIANEFFDALPIRQFQRAENGWRERQIGLHEAELSFGLSAPAPLAALDHRLDDTKPGDLVETCPAAHPILQTIGARIEANGGAALIFDYGDWRSLGDTLQAIRKHETVHPLSAPGDTDLTAHVDFEALVRDLPCAHSRLSTQGVVLERLGITQRAQSLAEGLDAEALENHIAAHRRLTHPGEMGTVFKSIALFPSRGAPPPGYEQ
ncbi:MAG: SAM-dependent methyltransferase [Pseudomonadota bacterium]